MELREHLENSLHFAVTTIDKMLLDLSCCDNFKSLFSALTSMHIQPHEDRIRWDQLRDNRDLEVYIIIIYIVYDIEHFRFSFS